jgi:hypothetical protein
MLVLKMARHLCEQLVQVSRTGKTLPIKSPRLGGFENKNDVSPAGGSWIKVSSVEVEVEANIFSFRDGLRRANYTILNHLSLKTER